MKPKRLLSLFCSSSFLHLSSVITILADNMAEDHAKSKGSADAFKNAVVDHHRLLYNEDYSDVIFAIDDKAGLHAHYNILKRNILIFNKEFVLFSQFHACRLDPEKMPVGRFPSCFVSNSDGFNFNSLNIIDFNVIVGFSYTSECAV